VLAHFYFLQNSLQHFWATFGIGTKMKVAIITSLFAIRDMDINTCHEAQR
jgi:hypothetical protein